MKKCEFQKGPTCQIFALKNAVELALNKEMMIFSRRDKYKFRRLEQLIIDADQCKSLNLSSYFKVTKKTKNEEYNEDERLPTFVAIFARAFPKFLQDETEIQFNYRLVSDDLSDKWKMWLFDETNTTTFVLILKNIMLGYSVNMLDPDEKEIIFGTSANIHGWKKTFTALKPLTTPSALHAVAIENIRLFGNQQHSVNVSAEELLWYYDLLQVSLLAEPLDKDDKDDETKWKLEANSVSEVLCNKFNMSKDDPRFASSMKNVTNEVLRTKMSLLNLLNDGDSYGYLNILDSNKIQQGTENCRWILPLSQFGYVVDAMINVTPVKKNGYDFAKPFVYNSKHFQEKNGLNTVLDVEKSIYKQNSNKLLTEQEIDEILSEGYVEGYFYETGDKILENDHVRVKGDDIEWEVWDFYEDEEKIVVIDRDTNNTKEVEQEQLTLLYRDSENESQTGSESSLKKRKINYELKF